MPCVVSQIVRWTHIKLCLLCTSTSQWVEPEGREKAPSVSPATGETLCTNTQATEEDVDRAVAAGERQWMWWGTMPCQLTLNSTPPATRSPSRSARLVRLARSRTSTPLVLHCTPLAEASPSDGSCRVLGQWQECARDTVQQRRTLQLHLSFTNESTLPSPPPSPVMLMCHSPFATFTPTLAGRS